MKKRVFMALLAAVATFAMTSCGDDDKKDNPAPATESSFGQNSNSVWLTTPLDEEDLEGMPEGSASQKVVWKWDGSGNITDIVATLNCSSVELAEALLKQTQDEMNDPESEYDQMGKIKDLKINGSTLTAIYEVPEGLTKMDAIVEAKSIAMLMGVKGVEYTEEEQAYANEQFNFDDDDLED